MLPPQSVRLGLVLSFLGLIFLLPSTSPLAAQAIVRAGQETAALGSRGGEQVWPSVSANATGGFLFWEDNAIGNSGGHGIAAAVLRPDMIASGEPFPVSVGSAGSQEKPKSVLLSNGSAFVAWEARSNGKVSVVGRVVTGQGQFASGEFRISPITVVTNAKRQVSLSGIFRNKAKTRVYKFKETLSTVREHAGGISLVALPDGGAAVFYHGVRRAYTNTWSLIRSTKWNGSKTTTNDTLLPVRLTGDWMQDVYMQRYSAAGEKVGGEIQVNQYEAYNQRDPAATLLANGNLLVTWVSERPQSVRSTDNFTVSLYAREIAIDGSPVSAEFPIGEDTRRASANPAVATVGTGFAVYWSQHEHDAVISPRWDVRGRVFSGANQPVGEVFTVNLYTQKDQFAPRVTGSGTAQMIVWTSVGQDGSREGVYGRALTDGVPSGDEVRINTTQASRQYQPALSAAGGNRVIAVWSGYAPDSGFNIYSQIIAGNPAAQ